MKIYKKLCLVAVALTCAVINYSGCANGSDSNSAAEVKEADVSYVSISRMAYIGGSLVYNSGKIGYGQLYNGVNCRSYKSCGIRKSRCNGLCRKF